MALEVWIRNDNVIEVKNVTNAVTGQKIADATVDVTVRNSRGEALEGQDWPYVLPPIEDSDGDYRGIIDDAVKLPLGIVQVEVNVDAGGGNKANRLVTARSMRGTA